MKPLFLIGFMGCGKSTWGRKLARISKLPFIDLDEKIVEETGMSIGSYFAEYGEAAFRQVESDVLKSVSSSEAAVISTGGGAPCYYDNMEWMNQTGITVYLELPAGVLLSRLVGKEGTKRPLLAGKTNDEILSFIEDKLAERKPFYEQAKVVVDAMRSSPQKLWTELLENNQ